MDAVEHGDFYLLRENETQGPYTFYQLRSMWAAGIITKNMFFCQEGDKEWRTLSELVLLLEDRPQNINETSAENKPEINFKKRKKPSTRTPGRNPKFAFLLSMLIGPLAWFYPGFKIGMSFLVTWLAAVVVDTALETSLVNGWPISMPTLSMTETFRWMMIIFVWIAFGAACAFVTNTKDVIQDWTTAFITTGWINGAFLFVPWILHDLAVGIGGLFDGQFLVGFAHIFFFPHGIVVSLAYGLPITAMGSIIASREIKG